MSAELCSRATTSICITRPNAQLMHTMITEDVQIISFLLRAKKKRKNNSVPESMTATP